MVDYAYYTGSYMGSRIPEKEFSGMATRAKSALERFDRCYHVVGGDDSRAMAVCAMAEALYADSRRSRGIAAESVGSVQVRYESDKLADQALWRTLYRQACIYLDIYRGVC